MPSCEGPWISWTKGSSACPKSIPFACQACDQDDADERMRTHVDGDGDERRMGWSISNSVVIRDAEVRPLEGETLQHVHEVWIKAKHIRYLHYPGWVEPGKIMEDMRAQWDAAGIKYTQPQKPPNASKPPT